MVDDISFAAGLSQKERLKAAVVAYRVNKLKTQPGAELGACSKCRNKGCAKCSKVGKPKANTKAKATSFAAGKTKGVQKHEGRKTSSRAHVSSDEQGANSSDGENIN